MAGDAQRRYCAATLGAVSRRAVMLGIAAAPVALFAPDLVALQDDGIDPKKLKPGQFVWKPENAPEGPVVVVVSIPDQMVTVYRNGVRIAVSSCSNRAAGSCDADRNVRHFAEGREPSLLAL